MSPDSALLLDQRDIEPIGRQSARQQAERAFGREAIAKLSGAGGGEDPNFCQRSDTRVERNLTCILVFGERGGDDLLIFFWLKRAGGIDDVAAGAHRA